MKNFDMTEFERVLKELMSACAMMGYSRSGQETANHKATRDKLREELLTLLAERQSQPVRGGGVSPDALIKAVNSALEVFSAYRFTNTYTKMEKELANFIAGMAGE